MLERAISIQENEGSGNEGGLGNSLRWMGASKQQQRQHPAAESYYERARPMLEADLGSTASEYGLFLRDLGRVYAHQEKLLEAEDSLAGALEILERKLGPQDPTVIETRRAYEEIVAARR
jgi:tetratricopeptide (TPR) repeat protein